jgi:hypothetical protein
MTNKQFDPSKPVQTRDGRKARIVCTDRKSAYNISIIALIQESNGFEFACGYFSDGRHEIGAGGGEHKSDLVNIPEKRWVNIYRNLSGYVYAGGRGFLTKGEAIKVRDTCVTSNLRDFIACVEIDWPV